MIIYSQTTEGITPSQLSGFFVGWPHPPTAETHLKILLGSSHVTLALDSDSNQVIGFATAISDGVLCAYLPLLEVLPDYQGRGIGQELMQRMLDQLDGYYVIDLVCDQELASFYKRSGMTATTAMSIRNYEHQSGRGAARSAPD